MNLKTSFSLILLCIVLPIFKASADLVTVPYVDLTKYLGSWYEIARYPNSFQKDCVAVKAEYSMQKNGKIKVVNSCRKISLDGEPDVAKGVARVADKTTNSKLKVSFAPFGLFAGNYWIILLDEDYNWVVVSEPKQKYLWVLSRTTQIEPKTWEHIKMYLTTQNFDLSKLTLTLQPGDPY